MIRIFSIGVMMSGLTCMSGRCDRQLESAPQAGPREIQDRLGPPPHHAVEQLSAEPAARRPGPDRVLMAGLLLIAAATAFRVWTASRSWFYLDDFPIVGRSVLVPG